MRHRIPTDGTTPGRRGDCHRCGWSQPLVRVHAHGHEARARCGYRWLCVDCLADLGREHPDVGADAPVEPVERPRHPVAHRVA